MALYKLTLSNGTVIETRNMDVVFDYIESYTGSEYAAIEATSWAELAAYGEIYEDGYFTLEIVED